MVAAEDPPAEFVTKRTIYISGYVVASGWHAQDSMRFPMHGGKNDA